MASSVRAALRREAKLLASEPTGWILLAVYTALLGYGAVQGIVSSRQEQAQIQDTRREYAFRWSTMEAKAKSASEAKEAWGSWRSASLAGSSAGGAVAWLEPGSLGVLNRGHSNRRDPVRRVSLYDSPVAPPLANPINVMYGPMDFGFIVLWVFPLVLILLAFQSFGRDRELGVWPLIFASGVSLRSLILLRLLIPASIVLSLTVACAVVAIVLTSNEFGLEFPIWIVLLTLYGAFWTMLAGYVSLTARSSARQLLILGALWSGAVWVMPGLLEVAAERSAPSVSVIEGLLAARQAQITIAEDGPRLLERVYAQHPDWRPAPELVSRMNQPVPGGPRRRDSRHIYSSYLLSEEATQHNQRRLSQRRVQIEAVAERFSMLSPLASMQLLSEEIAGTSPGRYQWFGVQAEHFIGEWRAFFAEKIWRLKDLRAADITGRPQYRWKSEPAGEQFRRVVWPAAGLILWLCLCAFLFFRRLERFSPM